MESELAACTNVVYGGAMSSTAETDFPRVKKRALVSVIAVLLLALLGANYLGFFAPPASSVVGRPIERVTLFDLENNKRSFDELLGEQTVIYFFTSWCAPCFETLGTLQEIREQHSMPLRLLAVAPDSDAAGVAQMVQESGFRGEVWMAEAGTMILQKRLFGNELRAVPYVVKLDNNTNISERAYKIDNQDAWISVLVDAEPLADATRM